MSEDFDERVRRLIAEREQRVATVHERVACPRCDAVVGEGCRHLRRRGRATVNPHVERLRADGISLR